ncbi:MAG: twin-arginine translocation signal domain-containing protein [Candidatus Levybacteria bacterium]|nr:twin-arginine translocation signal domain-containing protein [Candidatus Levybacteria bacterium]
MSTSVEKGQGGVSRRDFLRGTLKIGGVTVGLGATGDSLYQSYRYKEAVVQINNRGTYSTYEAFDKADDALGKMMRDQILVTASVATIIAGLIIPSTPDKPTT